MTEDIYLLDARTGKATKATLSSGIGKPQLDDWENHWLPALWRGMLEQKRLNAPIKDWWQESQRWDWKDKTARIQGLIAYQAFHVACDGRTQGMMQVDLTKTANQNEQKGKPLVYVKYLETAPWNRSSLYKPPYYHGVGTALIAAAITLSISEGYKGRIGLHALPQAEDFYANKCGMTDLGVDPSVEGLRYFEMTEEQAQSFLRKGGRS